MACELREWKIEDSGALSLLMNNPNIQNNLRDGIPYPYTKADAEDFIRSTLSAAPDSLFAFAIFSEGRLCGSISVMRQNNIHRRTGELGYYIAEEFWGRGIATEAVGKICRYVFENTDLVRIFAEPFSYNKASCRVLEKNAFQLEGLLRSNAEKNGKILDMKLYSLIKEQP